MRTINDLRQLQALPLSLKIRLTQTRIRQWVNEFGEDGVYIAFSGGKDSTVLLTIVRDLYPNIKAIFSDTGLEYPEVRDYVKKYSNVDWIKPTMTFKKVIEKHGYPFISKEVSERVYYAQKYLTSWKQSHSIDRPTDRPTDRPNSTYAQSRFLELVGAPRTSIKTVGNIPDKAIKEFIETGGKGTYKLRELYGLNQFAGHPSQYDFSKWKFLTLCPYQIGNGCCSVMKKRPMKKYSKETGRVPITAQMAQESRLRTQKWVLNGCNAFNLKNPISNPMSFWTEQDVLWFLKQENIKLPKVYGDIVKVNEIPGQMDFDDFGLDMGFPLLATTGVKRSGCMFCGFGCHLEKPGEGRFEKMKLTHPKQYDYIMKPINAGGLGYKEIIDWINENGNLNIRY